MLFFTILILLNVHKLIGLLPRRKNSSLQINREGLFCQASKGHFKTNVIHMQGFLFMRLLDTYLLWQAYSLYIANETRSWHAKKKKIACLTNV